jgi:FkbM family methyltransferase
MLIDWNEVLKNCPNITGVIHAGGHTGEEAVFYKDIPTKWIEADFSLYTKLNPNQLNFTKHWFAALDYKGSVILNVMEFKAANSILEPNPSIQKRKDINVVDRILVPADIISSIQEQGYNFLNLDIQGVELKALKGTDLSLIDYIYTEINDDEVYKECDKVWSLVEYLDKKGFKEICRKMTNKGWGDALFVKKQ